VDTNPSLHAMLGYRSDELLQMPFQAVIQPKDVEADQRFEQEVAAGTRDFYQLPKYIVNKKGESVPVNYTAVSIRDVSGKPSYTIGLLEEITSNDSLTHDVS
jgi:PAS domain S-box-containing protein